jgi:hypothetical protein
MALPLDAARAQAAGDVFPVAENVFLPASNTTAYAPVTLSENSVLLYSMGRIGEANQMGWYDRAGKSVGPVGARRFYAARQTLSSNTLGGLSGVIENAARLLYFVLIAS